MGPIESQIKKKNRIVQRQDGKNEPFEVQKTKKYTFSIPDNHKTYFSNFIKKIFFKLKDQDDYKDLRKNQNYINYIKVR